MRKQEKGGGGWVFVLEERDFEVHEILRAVSRGCVRGREMAGRGRERERERGRKRKGEGEGVEVFFSRRVFARATMLREGFHSRSRRGGRVVSVPPRAGWLKLQKKTNLEGRRKGGSHEGTGLGNFKSFELRRTVGKTVRGLVRWERETRIECGT